MAANSKPDYGEVGTIFFQDGYQLAKEFIGQGISRTAVLQLMGSAYESIDGLIDSFRKRCMRESLTPDCQKGCTLCCSQAVLASNHEILMIWQYIDEHMPARLIDEIKSRNSARHTQTRQMSAMEFLHYMHPCPFLDDGSCLIYPVRPMACRCYLSESMKSCQDQYDNPKDRTSIAALFDFPLRAGRGFNEGIRSALMEAGLIPSEWLLETFMAKVLKDATILEAWLAGNTPFRIRKLTPEETRYMRENYGRSGEYPEPDPK